MACAIFDQYLLLASMGHFQFDIKQMNVFCCTCLLIAAKFEQPKKPDFQNMVHALDELKKVHVKKQKFIECEQ